MEVNDAAEVIRRVVHPDATIMFGAVIDPTMQDEVQITVVATGFDGVVRRQPVLAATGTDNLRAFPVPPYDRDDLEIPPFLRNRKDTGKAAR